jgi:hypothetical protein
MDPLEINKIMAENGFDDYIEYGEPVDTKYGFTPVEDASDRRRLQPAPPPALPDLEDPPLGDLPDLPDLPDLEPPPELIDLKEFGPGVFPEDFEAEVAI